MKCKKQWKEQHIEEIEWFITTNSWWDTVDHLASNVAGTYFTKWPENKYDLINHGNQSNNLWLVRTSIIFQLKYKNKVDADLLAQCILPHRNNMEFFIRKAIGWALRSYAEVNPTWVIQFVNDNELQPLSVKEALRKLITHSPNPS
jgi:3-methyladenine DNA glycosylase AlkD